ncbi:MAG: hypothetical protein ACFCUS_06040 [Rubrimonas sp.]|uniref:hypothetical protein n=1 Tax=Rubrimonas sp. TaxID=2036015 RepID=UPI002FDE1B17
MEVSTFELIFKPQSPAAPSGVAAVERVIQGYFLAISNLEEQEYRYRLDFVAPPPAAGSPNAAFRTPAGNTVVFVDAGGGDNQQGVLNGGPTATVFRPSTGFVRVPAQGTALVAVLPSAFGPLPGEPTPLVVPNFEVRGFVRISLPAVRKPGGPFFQTVPQSKGPVRVLLTPQHRATFLDAGGAITDQIQTSLPVAGGAAIAALPPEPGGFIVFDSLVTPELFAPQIEGLSPAERGAMLTGLLAGVSEAGELADLNKELAPEIGLAIERRTKKDA